MTERKALKIRRNLRNLLSDTRGLSTVEYIIILALIAMVGISVFRTFGQTVRDKVDAADGYVNEQVGW